MNFITCDLKQLTKTDADVSEHVGNGIMKNNHHYATAVHTRTGPTIVDCTKCCIPEDTPKPRHEPRHQKQNNAAPTPEPS